MHRKDRRFNAHRPYLVTQRLRHGFRLWRCPKLWKLLLRQFVLAHIRTWTRIVGFFVLDNHVHLILVQDFTGQCKRHRRGISCFMRNAFAVWARMVNQRTIDGARGHVVERRFHAKELSTLGDLLQALMYVHGQLQHHQIGHLQAQWERWQERCSWGAAIEGRADGVVSDRYDLGMSSGQLVEMLEQAIALACELERQPDTDPSAWCAAMQATVRARVALGHLPTSALALGRDLRHVPRTSFDPERFEARINARLHAGILGRDYGLQRAFGETSQHVVAMVAIDGEDSFDRVRIRWIPKARSLQ